MKITDQDLLDYLVLIEGNKQAKSSSCGCIIWLVLILFFIILIILNFTS